MLRLLRACWRIVRPRWSCALCPDAATVRQPEFGWVCAECAASLREVEAALIRADARHRYGPPVE